ncbi:latent-transforming growth factor beta-binding protein 4-like isoform X2 [Leptidea sinapis]|uniref:latent-transforming growth factor beta-binding protein 4-like isoform X2 n=1 Tax=Leptidea sinapis TaxID=189913 RepID=UPI0021C490AF|nr:latent-transforming growth factor beta-binding protein 4-like isoform X2 [Leptidea sinapis]
MKAFVICFVLCLMKNNVFGLDSEEKIEITETCCSFGETMGIELTSIEACSNPSVPDEIGDEEKDTCIPALRRCCEEQVRMKEQCAEGIRMAESKQCYLPKTGIGRACCDECALGHLTGSTQDKRSCVLLDNSMFSPEKLLRSNAFNQCCLRAAEEIETTTEKKEITTTPKAKCKETSCEHICNDEDGTISCQCREGYRLQPDKRSCKDINECAEADDDLCTAEETVCHNTEGSFKCVPVKKRDVNLSCPPGFKRNIINQVCDDINECQSPRPPCPKYLCENTIGGYKCAGKPGKPFTEESPKVTTPPSAIPVVKNDICPPGFVAGPDDDCLDINECEERLDDCQRLSQYCINTHGSYFCQDHVSKRCSPGFKVNSDTGICEDIDECEESTEVCKRNEVCVNLPGAYNCKSKISTLPKLVNKKKCQEGTRIRPGGTVCEDIDECREGTHLCDQFQNCINTFGAHECRCKNGFELDSSTGSCVDIDECALKLDNCEEALHCLNVLGSFTCTRRPGTSSTTPPPDYEYEYYDSEEDSTPNIPKTTGTSSTSTTTTTTTLPNDDHYEIEEDNIPNIKPETTSTTPRSTTSTTTSRPNRTTPARRYPPYSPTTPRVQPSRPADTHRDRHPYNPTRYSPITTSTTPPSNDDDYYDTEEGERNKEIPSTTPRQTQPPTTSSTTTPRPRQTIPPRRYPFYPTTTPRTVPHRTDDRNRARPYPSYPTTSSTDRPHIRDYRPNVRPTPVDVGVPTDINTVETDKAPDGSYSVDTGDIPKDRWINVIGRDPEGPKFDPNDHGCLPGYERNERFECVDINECDGRHICSSLEICENRPGGYVCECIAGFTRVSGWCAPIKPTTERTTSRTSTTRRTTSTSTTSTTTVAPSSSTLLPLPRPSLEWPYTPEGNWEPSRSCEMGYTFSTYQGRCVDIDECATNTANCSSREDCVNIDGGYQCICGKRCRGENTPSYVRPRIPESNRITVGAQYGQRGPLHKRPIYSRLPESGAIVTTCPWGYKLTPAKYCQDIDECAPDGLSECGPQQTCENFYGGYSCQCPAGHRLVGKHCEDIDECTYASQYNINNCAYNSRCVNTIGSYRCECGDGFRNPSHNDKVCEDIDECSESASLCDHKCSNVWGGYRCYCDRGYRLSSDNRTCVDIDECAEWSSGRNIRKICSGRCENTPGSYRCACPEGYRLADDSRSCIDIDECEIGSADCSGEGAVCQNTRGSYHCHHIRCPPGYRLDGKHRCSRMQTSCRVGDWDCLQQPSTYSYNFITLGANVFLPQRSVNLFRMYGPSWVDSIVNFEMKMVDVQARPGIKPADLTCFDLRAAGNSCMVSLLCSLQGPQVAELEITMSLYQRAMFGGSAVARLVVIVSEYEF